MSPTSPRSTRYNLRSLTRETRETTVLRQQNIRYPLRRIRRVNYGRQGTSPQPVPVVDAVRLPPGRRALPINLAPLRVRQARIHIPQSCPLPFRFSLSRHALERYTQIAMQLRDGDDSWYSGQAGVLGRTKARLSALITANCAPNSTVIEALAHEVLENTPADIEVLYLGHLYGSTNKPRSERRFSRGEWARLVYLSAAHEMESSAALARVKVYLSSMQKVVALQELNGHMTCLSFRPQEREVMLFDTLRSQANINTTANCSDVAIASLFGQDDWELLIADITQQNPAANNCAFHSILRARRELLGQALDTCEAEAIQLLAV
ncbi:hypothetical protein VM1G_12090 [Cytospora mali]|uniref:Uncharacterized protein n=1 Tax=Cytospora mali TaxID=578113 RepID=A0A194VJX2_CYTMA|nr:hypothetical protein VM1G_12090 [Valsa mali]